MGVTAIPDRVFARAFAKRHAEGDCLISDYSIASHGYAQIGWVENGKVEMRLVHRVIWEWYYLLPADRTIDHMCRNRRCSNPLHLRLLTNVENATWNGNKIKTHCVRGHAFTKENTMVNKRGHRRCRQCQRNYNAARYR